MTTLYDEIRKQHAENSCTSFINFYISMNGKILPPVTMHIIRADAWITPADKYEDSTHLYRSPRTDENIIWEWAHSSCTTKAQLWVYED